MDTIAAERTVAVAVTLTRVRAIFHLHLNGRRLEDLVERESHDAAAGRFVKSYAKPEVLERRA